jgi:hypothetical protein
MPKTKSKTSTNSKNYIINGAMDFWQRATSISSGLSVAYRAADRFLDVCTIAAGSISRVIDAPDSGSRYSFKITGVATMTQFNLYHRIESFAASELVGSLVVISAWVKNNTGAAFNPIYGLYWPSYIDSWNVSTSIQIGSAQSCPDGQWTRISAVVNLGSAPVQQGLMVRLGVPSGSLDSTSKSVSFTQVMLTKGTDLVPFRRHGDNIGTEFAACQRYYTSILIAANPIAWAYRVSGSTWSATFSLPTALRNVPAVTLTNTPLVLPDDGTAGVAYTSIVPTRFLDSVVTVSGLAGASGLTGILRGAASTNVIFDAELY